MLNAGRKTHFDHSSVFIFILMCFVFGPSETIVDLQSKPIASNDVAFSILHTTETVPGVE
jgi:hypothetical protein